MSLKLPVLSEPLKVVWYKSWTKFLGYTQTITGAVLYSLSELHIYISDPTFKGYLGDLDVPKEITIGLAVLGIVTWLAHGREEST